MVEALAEGCNVPLYEVTGHPGQEARDVIGAWNRRAQDRAEDAAIASGLQLADAARRRWAGEYFECGEILDAYREAARAAEAGDPPPALLIDEVEKLPVPIQHTLFQPLARGFAAIPKLEGLIGVTDTRHAPIVVLTTNNLKLLDEPLKDRCVLTWIEPPAPIEEISIFHARVPHASAYLIGATVKMLAKIRDGMDEITRKPGIRSAVLLLGAMADHEVERVTRQSLELYLGCLARDETDEANLENGLPTLERAANRPDGVIDEAVRREFARTALHLCKEEAA
jgi:MoxR-like ATPase